MEVSKFSISFNERPHFLQKKNEKLNGKFENSKHLKLPIK